MTYWILLMSVHFLSLCPFYLSSLAARLQPRWRQAGRLKANFCQSTWPFLSESCQPCTSPRASPVKTEKNGHEHLIWWFHFTVDFPDRLVVHEHTVKDISILFTACVCIAADSHWSDHFRFITLITRPSFQGFHCVWFVPRMQQFSTVAPYGYR